jgi:DNA-binding SARP family transcriptional activator
LAILLLEQGRAVSAARLADVLWEGAPPDRARRTIHSHVARLRAELAHGDARSHGIDLTTTGGGYRIVLDDPGVVDVHRFRQLRSKASNSVDRSVAVAYLRAALDLWRGSALQGTASDWQREQLCADLEELRLTALEDFLAGSLELRREREVQPELAAAATAHPGRERLAELSMQALHRMGRRAEALAVYARTRSYLVNELGLDPGPALSRLQEAILRDEAPPALPADGGAGTSPTDATVPRQLPGDPATFAGRGDALRALDGLLSASGADPPRPVVISAITGTAGVGKTALAVHWGHQISGRFPDGQLYVNLRGFDPGGRPMEPAEALRDLLDALQVPPHRVPASVDAQAGLYRSVLAGRRMLVLLDNARDAEQVRPLLPGSAGCLALVTSRDQLSNLVAAEGAHPFVLDLLTRQDARQLLARRLGHERASAEPDATDEIIDRCARLPLALAIVAARAALQPRLRLRTLADQLCEAGGLDATTGPGSAFDLREVFSWSYRTLSTDTRRLFRLLGLHPGPDFSVPAAASLAGIQVSRARHLLLELGRAHLVAELSRGRYTFHDLLRAYATDLAQTVDTAADRRSALHRLLDHYLVTAHTAALLLSPYRSSITLTPARTGAAPVQLAYHDQAWIWFTSEYGALRAAIVEASHAGFDTHCWQLAWALSSIQDRRGHWPDQIATQRVALDAARRGADRNGQAHAHRCIGLASIRLCDYGEAHSHLQQAVQLFHEVGDTAGQALAHGNLGQLSGRQANHRDALFHTKRALELLRAAGAPRVAVAAALNNVGLALGLNGDYRQALSCCREALALFGDDDPQGRGATWDTLGFSHHQLRDYDQALSCYERALHLYRETNDPLNQADVLTHLGDTHHTTGDDTGAWDAWQQAAALLDELDHPDADQVREKLHKLHGRHA